MSTQLERRYAAVGRSVKHEIGSKVVVELVKLLDTNAASDLVFFYHLYPEEILRDLAMIKAAIRSPGSIHIVRGMIEMVEELFAWYRDRHLREISGVNTDHIPPKSELALPRWWAQRQSEEREREALLEAGREARGIRSDDIPF